MSGPTASQDIPHHDGHDRELARLQISEQWLESFVLASGKVCALKEPRTKMAGQHLLLYYPDLQGEPTVEEQSEMLGHAVRIARQWGERLFRDPGAYSILHNGSANTRVPDFHIHIFVLNSRIDELFHKIWERNVPTQ